MAIDETVVRHLERLAALRLGDDERRRLAARLARVVAYVEQLRELDTSGVPVAPPPADAAPRRADEPGPSLPVGEATATAPAAGRGFFVVPPAFGGDDG